MKENLSDFIQKAKTIQDDVRKTKKKLEQIVVKGESGAGLVKIFMTCENTINKIYIDRTLLKEDKNMLEDLIVAAFNDAIRKTKDKTNEKMKKITYNIFPDEFYKNL